MRACRPPMLKNMKIALDTRPESMPFFIHSLLRVSLLSDLGLTRSCVDANTSRQAEIGTGETPGVQLIDVQVIHLLGSLRILAASYQPQARKAVGTWYVHRSKSSQSVPGRAPTESLQWARGLLTSFQTHEVHFQFLQLRDKQSIIQVTKSDSSMRDSWHCYTRAAEDPSSRTQQEDRKCRKG